MRKIFVCIFIFIVLQLTGCGGTIRVTTDAGGNGSDTGSDTSGGNNNDGDTDGDSDGDNDGDDTGDGDELVDNEATLEEIANISVDEGDPISTTLSFSAIRPADVSFTATSSNTALVAHASVVISGSGATTRTITITPVTNAFGSSTITIQARDLDSSILASRSFVLTIANVNDAPTISDITDRSIWPDSNTGAINFTVNDVDGDVLTVSGESSNQTLVIDDNIVFGGSGSSRTVTITPEIGQIGSATITITVSDGVLTASDTFVLTVEATAPTLSFAGAAGTSVTAGAAMNVTPTTLSANGEDITDCKIKPGSTNAGAFPGTLSVHTSTCVISGTPTESFSSTSFTLIATNEIGNSNDATVSLTVTPAAISTAQSLVSVSAASVSSNSTVTVTLQAKDQYSNNLAAGNSTVAFSLSGDGTSSGSFPDGGAATDNNNGTYSATFTGTTAGTAKTISATIGGNAVTSTALITVTAGAATKLAFTGGSASGVSVDTCSTAITVQVRDIHDNAVTQSGSSRTVELSSALTGGGSLDGTTTYFSNDNCTTPIADPSQDFAIADGQSSRSFYIQHTSAESITLTASASGLTGAEQDVVVAAANLVTAYIVTGSVNSNPIAGTYYPFGSITSSGSPVYFRDDGFWWMYRRPNGEWLINEGWDGAIHSTTTDSPTPDEVPAWQSGPYTGEDSVEVSATSVTERTFIFVVSGATTYPSYNGRYVPHAFGDDGMESLVWKHTSENQYMTRGEENVYWVLG